MFKRIQLLLIVSVCAGLLCSCAGNAVPAADTGEVKEENISENTDAADETEKDETKVTDEEDTKNDTVSDNADVQDETVTDETEVTDETVPEEDADLSEISDERPVFTDRANATEGIGEPKELHEGDVAPDFTVELATGELLTLSEYDDRIVLLNFWATWCPPCVGEMPAFERLNKEMGDDVLILSVDCGESRKDVDSFIAEYGYTYRIGYDQDYEINDYYPTDGIPYTLVIDHGIIKKIFVGAYDADTMYIEYGDAIKECAE
ncbi:MAG: redoxin domain-containing protein [Lachnospiraceae bacterium]|nr:redoxin domain-containing protein [Lachnospiraceae bacterium]